MVITCIVDDHGCVYLGTERDDSGKRRARRLRLGKELNGRQVDVRFDNGTLSVITKDHNGQDTDIPSSEHKKWTMTGEKFSRLPGVHNTTAPLPPPRIDPGQPMVITCIVDYRGRAYLGKVKRADARNSDSRHLNVGEWLYGQQVDVRFADTVLYVITKNHNGQDTDVPLSGHRKWTMTREEFSRLNGVRNTTDPLPQAPVDPVDPTKPMVITRTVDGIGYMHLGRTQGGDAGKRRPPRLYVDDGLCRKRVDVYFDNGTLSVIAQNGNDQDTVVTLSNRTEWTLTGEEFSRLPGACNISVPEAVSPAGTVIDQRRAGSPVRVDGADGDGDSDGDLWALLERQSLDEWPDLFTTTVDVTPPTIDQVLRGLDPRPDVDGSAGGTDDRSPRQHRRSGKASTKRSARQAGLDNTHASSSQPPNLRTSTAGPLPPPIVDPDGPMVVTRTVHKGGRVHLGSTANGGHGQSRQRVLYVGDRLYDKQVDVHFGDKGLSVTTKDHDGQDTDVPLKNRRTWTMTGEMFSQLSGVRNTAVPEAVSPAVTGAAERHPMMAVGSDPSGEAVTVRRPAASHDTSAYPRLDNGGSRRVSEVGRR